MGSEMFGCHDMQFGPVFEDLITCLHVHVAMCSNTTVVMLTKL